jgi:hypothetical protein
LGCRLENQFGFPMSRRMDPGDSDNRTKKISREAAKTQRKDE